MKKIAIALSLFMMSSMAFAYDKLNAIKTATTISDYSHRSELVSDIFADLEHPNFNPKWVNSIQYNERRDEVVIDNDVYDENDGNCCPSLRYKVVINVSDIDNPFILETKPLGRAVNAYQ